MQGWTTSIQNLIKFSEIPTVVVLGPLIFEIHPHLHGWDCKVDSFLGFRSAKLWEVLPDARGLWDVQAYGLKWIDAGCPKKWGMCCSFFGYLSQNDVFCIQYLLPQHNILERSTAWYEVRFGWFLLQNASLFQKLQAAFWGLFGVVVNDHLEWFEIDWDAGDSLIH